jgi:hypothetical protein
MSIDANFVGIGGIQEPRKVGLIIETDINDPNMQLLRVVCTWPARKKSVQGLGHRQATPKQRRTVVSKHVADRYS